MIIGTVLCIAVFCKLSDTAKGHICDLDETTTDNAFYYICDDPEMPDLLAAPGLLVVHRPSVRLSSAEAEVDAAICADQATMPLMASSSSAWYVIYVGRYGLRWWEQYESFTDVLTRPFLCPSWYDRVRLFMGVPRV